jgi:hypothetical protein
MLKRNVEDFPLSNVDYIDIRNHGHTAFEGFAAFQTFRGTMRRDDGALERTTTIVSPQFLPAHGPRYRGRPRLH